MIKALLALVAVTLMFGILINFLVAPVAHKIYPHTSSLVGYGCVGHTGPVFTFGDEDTLPVCKRIERRG